MHMCVWGQFIFVNATRQPDHSCWWRLLLNDFNWPNSSILQIIVKEPAVGSKGRERKYFWKILLFRSTNCLKIDTSSWINVIIKSDLQIGLISINIVIYSNIFNIMNHRSYADVIIVDPYRKRSYFMRIFRLFKTICLWKWCVLLRICVIFG